MKTKLLILAGLLVALSGCQSASEQRMERVQLCNQICTDHPAIKAMTFDEGGGSLLFLGGGYQKDSCACTRKG